MKILWIVNICLPEVSEEMNLGKINVGGWLTGLKDNLVEFEDIDLEIVFPHKALNEVKIINKNKVKYYGIPTLGKINESDLKLKIDLRRIIEESKPDIIHIHGTEFIHSFLATEICKELKVIQKVVISIQGLVSIYEKHYHTGLPEEIVKSYTIREILQNLNIEKQRKLFKQRGYFEELTIKNTSNIIGRTDWDKACTSQINPNINYYFCNESLRNEFYKNQWSYENCKKNSIFISQASYPIKGLHYLIDALPLILDKFPDTKVFIAGSDITTPYIKGIKIISSKKIGNFILKGLSVLNIDSKKIINYLLLDSYGRFIKKKIKQKRLNEVIQFTGDLNEKEMCQRYLDSNVFVSASTIENSPNSVGEAMLLGVPVVSSDVGGVKDLLEHNKEGYIYQHDAPYMLAFYIMKIFEDSNLANKISKNAQIKAKKTHDRNINSSRTVEIYRKIKHKNEIE